MAAVLARARAATLPNEMETEMKMIMAALAASAVLVGIAAPASAGAEMTVVASEYMQAPSGAAIRRVKMRSYVPRQPEYDASRLPIGTSAWWQQMDREGRGGRR
jgi:hypothetical protein